MKKQLTQHPQIKTSVEPVKQSVSYICIRLFIVAVNGVCKREHAARGSLPPPAPCPYGFIHILQNRMRPDRASASCAGNHV